MGNDKVQPPDIAAIRARANAATPGPWIADLRVGCVAVYAADERANCMDQVMEKIFYRAGQWDGKAWRTDETDEAHATFIAAARTDVPQLCDALDAANARVAGLEAAIANERSRCVGIAMRYHDGSKDGQTLRHLIEAGLTEHEIEDWYLPLAPAAKGAE